MTTPRERLLNVRNCVAVLLPQVVDAERAHKIDVAELVSVLKVVHVEVSAYFKQEEDCRPPIPNGGRHLEKHVMTLERIWSDLETSGVTALKRHSALLTGGGEQRKPNEYLLRHTSERVPLRAALDRQVVIVYTSIMQMFQIFHDPDAQKLVATELGIKTPKKPHRHRHHHKHKPAAAGADDLKGLDRKARALWEINFGTDLMVPRTRFYAMLRGTRATSKRLRKTVGDKAFEAEELCSMDYILDPSSTGWVTSRRFAIALHIFGAVDSICEGALALSHMPGFSGWLARVEAHKLLEDCELGFYVIYLRVAGDWRSSKPGKADLVVSCVVESKGKRSISDTLFADIPAVQAFLKKKKSAAVTPFSALGLTGFPFFFGELSANEAALILAEKAEEYAIVNSGVKPEGLFLTRQSTQRNAVAIACLSNGQILHDLAIFTPEGKFKKDNESTETYDDLCGLLEAHFAEACMFPCFARVCTHSPPALKLTKTLFDAQYSVAVRASLITIAHPDGGVGSVKDGVESDAVVRIYEQLADLPSGTGPPCEPLEDDYLFSEGDISAAIPKVTSHGASLYGSGASRPPPRRNDSYARRATMMPGMSKSHDPLEVQQVLTDSAQEGTLDRTPGVQTLRPPSRGHSRSKSVDAKVAESLYGKSPAISPKEMDGNTTQSLYGRSPVIPDTRPSETGSAAAPVEAFYGRSPVIPDTRPSETGSAAAPVEAFYGRSPVAPQKEEKTAVVEQSGGNDGSGAAIYGRTPIIPSLATEDGGGNAPPVTEDFYAKSPNFDSEKGDTSRGDTAPVAEDFYAKSPPFPEPKAKPAVEDFYAKTPTFPAVTVTSQVGYGRTPARLVIEAEKLAGETAAVPPVVAPTAPVPTVVPGADPTSGPVLSVYGRMPVLPGAETKAEPEATKYGQMPTKVAVMGAHAEAQLTGETYPNAQSFYKVAAADTGAKLPNSLSTVDGFYSTMADPETSSQPQETPTLPTGPPPRSSFATGPPSLPSGPPPTRRAGTSAGNSPQIVSGPNAQPEIESNYSSLAQIRRHSEAMRTISLNVFDENGNEMLVLETLTSGTVGDAEQEISEKLFSSPAASDHEEAERKQYHLQLDGKLLRPAQQLEDLAADIISSRRGGLQFVFRGLRTSKGSRRLPSSKSMTLR